MTAGGIPPAAFPACGAAMWVFGFGSLMWNPGFTYDRACPAVLHGYHRCYCMYSMRGRGTREKPGMMLGLVPGGRCAGLAFQVERPREAEVLAYLDRREGVGWANRRVMMPIEVHRDGTSRRHNSWVYMPDAAYEGYVGWASDEDIARRIVTGEGERGTSYAYFRALMDELHRLEIEETRLERLLELVERYRAEAGEGAPQPPPSDRPA